MVVACSLLSLFVGGCVFFGFTAYFEPLRKEFGWSYAQISLAIGLRGLEMSIFAPLAGLLTVRFGPRKLIFCGIITLGAGVLLLSQTQSLTMFYLSFLVIALGGAGCTAVVTMTAVANWFSRRVGLALGIVGSGAGAGGLVVLLIVYLIEVYQWRTTLVIMGIGLWAVGIPLSLIIRNRPEDYGCGPDGSTLPSSSKQSDNIMGSEVEISFREILKIKPFLYLNIVEAVRLLTITTVILHIMPYMSSLGVSRPTSALVAAAIPIIGIIGRFGFGWLSDLIEKRYVLMVTFSLLTMAMLVFSLLDFSWLVIPFLLFFPLGHGGSMVLRGSILREYFGRKSFGKMMGILMGVGSLGGIIGPTVAGWGFDVLGTYQPIWILLCILLLFSTFLVSRIK